MNQLEHREIIRATEEINEAGKGRVYTSRLKKECLQLVKLLQACGILPVVDLQKKGKVGKEN